MRISTRMRIIVLIIMRMRMHVRMRGRVCEGVCREGKQEVRREEGMGEADGVIAGYSWRVCVRAFVYVCSRVSSCFCVRASVPLRVIVCWFACICLCACVRAYLYSLKPLRGPPMRRMQRADHHRLFQST